MMRKHSYMFCVFFLLLGVIFACAVTNPQGPQGVPGPQGIPGPAGTPTTTVPTAIQNIVQEQNDYRSTIGQDPLQPGLTCTLYTVAPGTNQIVGATLTNVGSFGFTGVFNQPNTPVTNGLDILPAALQPIYQSWYIVKCSGNYVAADSNWHSFQLSSDDGSNLYFDGGLLINNDGLHGIQTVAGTKLIQYGFHNFELDFLQANGQQALILNLDGSLLDSTHFYH